MKTLTFDVPDEVYETCEQMAAKGRRRVEDVALEWLVKEAADCRSLELPQKGRPAPRRSFRDYAGAVSSGDPHSGDNDRIDADLAREYASTHEEGEE